MLETNKGATKNEQSGNTTQKTKTMSSTDTTKIVCRILGEKW